MRVLVIPDVHLKPWMFDRLTVKMNEGIAEKAVCLMDIPDDWGKEYNLELYEATFDAAIRFQKAFPETLWCYGNHDLAYIWNQHVPGFSYTAAYLVKKKLYELQEKCPNDSQLAYIHKIDNVLFLHGGLTDPFVNYYVKKEGREDPDIVISHINSLDCSEMWDDASPLWLRPQYYQEKMYKAKDLLQIVGHTPVEKITREGNVVSCDVFSTYRNGEPIGTQEFLLIDTITWKHIGIS